MRLRDVFLVSLYVLFAEATMLLVVGEGRAFPQALGFPLVVVALILVDRRRMMRVPAWGLNVAAAIGVAAAAWEFFGELAESRLTAAAHLMVYLGWVVLFGEKTDRQYWWLLTLSVLQVAVGAVLVDAAGEPLYSFLVVAFMITATWTLSVFSLQQVQGRFAAVPAAVGVPEGPGWFRPTAVVSGWQLDANQQWINPRFVLGVAGAAVGALAGGAVFFLLIPRLWLFDPSGLDVMDNDPLNPLTGFTETVQLGEIGDILESTEHVMSVGVVDRQTGDRVDVAELSREWGDPEPMFRGTVMVGYSSGKWERGLPDSRFDRMPGVPATVDGLRQDVQLETLGTPVLFGMHPVHGCDIDGVNRHGLYQSATGVLVGSKNRKRGRVLRYSLFSPPLKPGETGRPRVLAVMTQAQKAEYLRLPQQGLGQMTAVARRLIAGVPSDHDLEKSRRLMEYLASEQFGYSLDASVDDPELDPVEDFLFRRKRGHCEYFASSLALMLRAVNIPSRLVSGFKGGTHNQISGQFVVQQRHAHAWVEAWIGARWVTLDPTPAARGDLIRELEMESRFLRDAGQMMHHSWRRYVVELSLAQQQSLFYRPLQAGMKRGISIVGEFVGDLVLGVSGLASGRGAGRRWPAILAMVALVGWAVLAVWLVRRWRAGWRPRTRFRNERVPVVVLPVYERYCRMVAARGCLRRRSGQTAREFAEELVHGPIEIAEGLGPIAVRVTNLYYAVRFGRQQPDLVEVGWIERELDRVDLYPTRRRKA